MHKIRFSFSEALDYRTVKGFPASIILAAQSRPAYNLLCFFVLGRNLLCHGAIALGHSRSFAVGSE
jgi:hypothetical protein